MRGISNSKEIKCMFLLMIIKNADRHLNIKINLMHVSIDDNKKYGQTSQS